ncbi:DUF6273 domain-containing protein [Clostridium sp.]|uniref:DUF6273 domain-containing protein n=1 Tax=Clostridium sp. TaxID=1506 RepID=UPI003D6D414D
MFINKSHYFLIVFVLISIISISGCQRMKKDDASSELTLKGIAFDVNEKSEYTVYIEENSKFVPYLVLTADYNGQALLLRKELLHEPRTFNDDSYGYSGYYKDSSIDKFLIGDFLSTIDTKIQSDIVDSKITITAKSSMGATGGDTENINRKSFLLSATELGFTDTDVTTEEGKPLKYFKDSKSRIAFINKEARSWRLRTPETWDIDNVCGIGPNGALGYGGPDSKNGIRPAFCIKNTQKIEKNNKVIAGQTVYVITK